MLFDNMIWGEADCFVQYYFPAQQQSQPPGAPVIRHGMYFKIPILLTQSLQRTEEYKRVLSEYFLNYLIRCTLLRKL